MIVTMAIDFMNYNTNITFKQFNIVNSSKE